MHIDLKKPPSLATWVLKRIIPNNGSPFLLGDFEEVYNEMLTEKGPFYTHLWYWWHIAITAPEFIFYSIFWSVVMIKNYIKIAVRNLTKNKGYSFINISGLAIGMACCLFITMWVIDELNWDRFHENVDRIYRVVEDQNYSGEIYHVHVTPYPLGPALKEQYTDFTDVTRFTHMGGLLMKYKDKAFFESGLVGTDPSFFNIFSFELLEGDRTTCLNDKYSMVITEEVAKKYFGTENPVGKVISANNQYEFTITGVAKKLPANSTLNFSILIPMEFLREIGVRVDMWGANSIYTYGLLKEDADPAKVGELIAGVIKEHNSRSATTLSLEALPSLHLHAYWGFNRDVGALRLVYMFSIIALFVLLIACINFMNLSTARSANRAKEIGLRKVVGAMKIHVIRQFIGESMLLSVIAFVIALGIVALLMPQFNTLAGKDLSLNIFKHSSLIFVFLAITLFTGFIAGSYPAFYLSAFRPVQVLKGSLKSGAKSSRFRQALVVIQFSLSIFLIVGTGVLYQQLNYMKNKSLGYKKDNVIYVTFRGEMSDSYPALKQAFKKVHGVLGVSGANHLPTQIGSNASGAEWDGKDPEKNVLIGTQWVDFDYIEALDMKLVEGRSFSESFSTDTSSAFLVNEEVLKLMGAKSAVGKRFHFMGADGKIIGVMKDFHFGSVKWKIDPVAFRVMPRRVKFMIVSIDDQNPKGTIDRLSGEWIKIMPDFPFDFHFLDDQYDRMYRSDERMGTILSYFAGFAIFIACLGLFGLASFTAEQRTKEIGIRKALGATTPNITYILCKEFLILVLISNVIALPAAWFALRAYLTSFAYRISLGPVLFIVTALLALIIALATVSYQALKAALSDPVKALRYE